jgi:hypothetical protein
MNTQGEMSILESTPIIEDCVLNHEALLLVSEPGIGKSSICKQSAKKLDFDFYFSSAALKNLVYFTGMPHINKQEEFEFITLDFMNKLINAKKNTLVLFDDLGWAVQSIQLLIADLILSREINGQKISDFVSFISCTNRLQDRAGVNPIPEPVKSRFSAIIKLYLDIDSFIAHGIEKDFDSTVLAFSKFKPEYLQFKPSNDITPSIRPRTLEMLSNKIKRNPSYDINLITSVCGYEYALDFMNFRRIFDKLPNLNDIISGKITNADFDLEILYLVIVKLISKIDHTNIDKIFDWVNKIEHKELQALFITLAKHNKPAIVELSNNYKAWITVNQNNFNF